MLHGPSIWVFRCVNGSDWCFSSPSTRPWSTLITGTRPPSLSRSEHKCGSREGETGSLGSGDEREIEALLEGRAGAAGNRRRVDGYRATGDGQEEAPRRELERESRRRRAEGNSRGGRSATGGQQSCSHRQGEVSCRANVQGAREGEPMAEQGRAGSRRRRRAGS